MSTPHDAAFEEDLEYSRPPTAQSAVLSELRRRMGSGRLRPGESLRTELLAKEFGVSRVPVREAMRVLEGEGQIQHIPHRGYRVVDMSLRDLKELYRMRGLLESDAMLETVPALGVAEFTVMQEALERMSRANVESDVRAHSLANRDFHQALWNSLPWPRMHHQLELLYDWCTPYGALFYNEHENRELVAREHESMLAAAREHDTAGVVELVRAHRVHVIEALEPVLYADELAIQVSDSGE